ncbi:MAG: DUF481 domain-containing protein [Phycisphaeraceae bacterium]|nr:DUF481 domain-containing protein [Phycisphaeraceae bacterium]
MVMRVLSSLTLSAMLLAGSAALADEVVLKTGDRLIGAVLEQTAEKVTVQHPVLGKLEIPASQVAQVVKEGDAQAPVPAAPAPTPVAAAVAAAPKSDAPALPERESWFDRMRKVWKSHFELGANITSGNSEAVAFYSAFKTTRETKSNTLKLDAAYYRNTSDGTESRDNFTTGLFSEWPIADSRWSVFAQGRYDYDEYQSWLHRLTGAGGLGYDLIKLPKFDFKLRGGAGFAREFGSEDENIKPEGLAGFDSHWTITDAQTLAARSMYYPDMGSLGEFRVVSAVEWLVKLSTADGLSLKVAIEHEYQSEVDPGRKNNDLRLISAIVFDF